MNAFEFGYVVGAVEKQSENVPGHGFENTLRGAVKVPNQALGGVAGGLVGAGVGLGNMPFRGLNSVARGMDSGVNAGTRVMDKMMGGPATGIGGKLLRLPAQAIGAAGGAVGGAIRAPFSAVGGVAHDTMRGAVNGANLAGRATDAVLPAPSYQQPAQANQPPAPAKVANAGQQALEFGYAVGAAEKTSNIAEKALLETLRFNPLMHAGLGAAGYAPVGAALGAYKAPSGQKLRGAGRGALTGAVTGAGIGAGSALGAKAIGGLGGIDRRALAGGMKNHLINQLPNVTSLAGGVAGYQLAKQRPAAK